MAKRISILMLSCRKASELIDKKSVFKLSLKEKVMLGMHTQMCEACKAYEKQSVLLDAFMKDHLQRDKNEVVPF